VTAAYQQDEAEEAALGSRRGDALPAELARPRGPRSQIEEAMRRLEAQAKADAAAERARRAAAEAERRRTGQENVAAKSPTPIEEDSRRQSPAEFYGSRAAYHAYQQQGVGLLWQRTSQRGRGVSDHLGLLTFTDATHDKQQAATLAQATLTTLAQAGMEQPKDESGDVPLIPATLDNGYYSEGAVQRWRP